MNLAIPVSDGLKVLEATGGSVIEEYDRDERSYRINLQNFEMAIYDTNGIVTSVWYNDPAGRFTKLGRSRKIRLYMARYTTLGEWEQRLNNGWMSFYFNDADSVQLVHGLHKDVIRINMLEEPSADAA